MTSFIQLNSRGGILIEEVSNGWIVRHAGRDATVVDSVQVAETPERLVELIGGYAHEQHAKRAGVASMAGAYSQHLTNAA